MGKALLLLFLLTNIARVGVAPQLVHDPALDSAAQWRANWICAIHQWSHKDWEDSFTGLSYQWHGENLAKGSGNMMRVEAALEASPEHEENIVNPHYTAMGVGYAPDCEITVELYGG